jgi:hypothetical protein
MIMIQACETLRGVACGWLVEVVDSGANIAAGDVNLL